VPAFPPRALSRSMEERNAATAQRAPATFGRLVGAPVVHASISGDFRCPMPEIPALSYEGRFEGGALVAAADGTVLALRRAGEGSGIAIAEVDLRRVPPAEPVPRRHWLHRRGLVPALAWNTQRLHGRRWYRRHVRSSPGPPT
jgi:predicted amidohydrolase